MNEVERKLKPKSFLFPFFISILLILLFLGVVFQQGAYSCSQFVEERCYYFNNFNQICHCENSNFLLTNEMIDERNEWIRAQNLALRGDFEESLINNSINMSNINSILNNNNLY